MASIIKRLNKQTGITYVYESESYWDKEKKQCRKQALSDYYKTAVKLEEALELIVKLTAWVNHNYENSSLPSSKCINREKITPAFKAPCTCVASFDSFSCQPTPAV